MLKLKPRDRWQEASALNWLILLIRVVWFASDEVLASSPVGSAI
jgi:hypothetical protein